MLIYKKIMSLNAHSMESLSASRRSISEIVQAGTEGLEQSAVEAVITLLGGSSDRVSAGETFIKTYLDAAQHRADHEGELPDGLSSTEIEAIKAINNLERKVVSNILEDPGLRLDVGGTEAGAYSSFPVTALPVHVTHLALVTELPPEVH